MGCGLGSRVLPAEDGQWTHLPLDKFVGTQNKYRFFFERLFRSASSTLVKKQARNLRFGAHQKKRVPTADFSSRSTMCRKCFCHRTLVLSSSLWWLPRGYKSNGGPWSKPHCWETSSLLEILSLNSTYFFCLESGGHYQSNCLSWSLHWLPPLI